MRTVPIWMGLLVFVIAFGAGAASKMLIKPGWMKQYNVPWSDALGTREVDLEYGPGKEEKFDLYLPKDKGKKDYSLVVYLHAGGFTSGDKSDDEQMLSWLCSKGYVAAGINYTLRTEENPGASVLSQSEEIKEAIPKVVEAAKKAGYPINAMAIGGGSAGDTLAMLYAYRDGKDAPVPVKLVFGGVGPSSFNREDWGIFGLDQDSEQSIKATQELFGTMLGSPLTAEEIKDGSYLEKMKPIAAADWITPDSPPTVEAYGTDDKVQPFKASLRLKKALEDNHVDHVYIEFPHSGHGLQNDDALSKKWMDAINEYLDKYLPVNQ